jgi:hypothetical protein
MSSDGNEVAVRMEVEILAKVKMMVDVGKP